MKKEEWNELFYEEKVAQQRLAGIVFWDIQQEPVKFSNCATNINIRSTTNPAPS